jgi:hypothetical protein
LEGTDAGSPWLIYFSNVAVNAATGFVLATFESIALEALENSLKIEKERNKSPHTRRDNN